MLISRTGPIACAVVATETSVRSIGKWSPGRRTFEIVRPTQTAINALVSEIATITAALRAWTWVRMKASTTAKNRSGPASDLIRLMITAPSSPSQATSLPNALPTTTPSVIARTIRATNGNRTRRDGRAMTMRFDTNGACAKGGGSTVRRDQRLQVRGDTPGQDRDVIAAFEHA